ncbi:6-mannosyltransferase MNN10 (Bud emergence delay protein 1) (Mannan polymerase II complex MNN10 subunit) (M-Pol II subunit MNN10) [Durusdinium trenchii]|uniref:6-mannosyltransferase MNN10 (Bud emergence delay protein 1) (Mannan polymerase II complex MNN10 subunit) (M-Pol II subunit MNN10) n=1 Tax=Durusdinium trenchii TaxID=1381693 RepID=A0ABP0SSP1_9DINO
MSARLAAVTIALLLLCSRSDAGPYDLVAVQLLEEECPASTDREVLNAWHTPTVASLEARAHLAGNFGRASRAAALAHWLAALLRLFEEHLPAAFQCSALCAQHLQSTAEWSLSLDYPRRARILIQLGNAFKFQALKDFANLYHEIKAVHGEVNEAVRSQSAMPKRFLPRLHIQYQIMLGQLHEALRVHPLPWQHDRAQSVEIHSICAYQPDPTSKTSLESPLLELSVPNHRAYAQRHGYRYVVHTENVLPDREAHYSKMYVVHQRMQGGEPHWAHQSTMPAGPPPEWIFFIDCDAFFTDFETSIGRLLATYSDDHADRAAAAAVQFLVAEDPGGINTGVFLIRNSPWSVSFLERVASSNFMVAWDQSMFFWHMVRGALDMDLAQDEDFTYPKEVRLVHQAHFNAFVPPASVDWMAYEWRPGDFVRHFAGCPWQEQPCLKMMLETAQMAPLRAQEQAEYLARTGVGGPAKRVDGIAPWRFKGLGGHQAFFT